VPVETGQEAPDFTLKDQDGNDVSLSSFRGTQNVVIVFYPFTFTGVCEGELCSLRDDLSEFDASANLATPRERAEYEAPLAKLR
jgi:peroxiredoxin